MDFALPPQPIFGTSSAASKSSGGAPLASGRSPSTNRRDLLTKEPAPPVSCVFSAAPDMLLPEYALNISDTFEFREWIADLKIGTPSFEVEIDKGQSYGADHAIAADAIASKKGAGVIYSSSSGGAGATSGATASYKGDVEAVHVFRPRGGAVQKTGKGKGKRRDDVAKFADTWTGRQFAELKWAKHELVEGETASEFKRMKYWLQAYLGGVKVVKLGRWLVCYGGGSLLEGDRCVCGGGGLCGYGGSFISDPCNLCTPKKTKFCPKFFQNVGNNCSSWENPFFFPPAVASERTDDYSRVDRFVDYDVDADVDRAVLDDVAPSSSSASIPLLSERQKIILLRVLEGLLANLRAMLLAAARAGDDSTPDGSSIFNLLVSRTADGKCSFRIVPVPGVAPSCVTTAFQEIGGGNKGERGRAKS